MKWNEINGLNSIPISEMKTNQLIETGIELNLFTICLYCFIGLLAAANEFRFQLIKLHSV